MTNTLLLIIIIILLGGGSALVTGFWWILGIAIGFAVLALLVVMIREIIQGTLKVTNSAFSLTTDLVVGIYRRPREAGMVALKFFGKFLIFPYFAAVSLWNDWRGQRDWIAILICIVLFPVYMTAIIVAWLIVVVLPAVLGFQAVWEAYPFLAI